MFNICFLCLKDINKLQSVCQNRTDDAVKQMKYVLPEITLESEIPVHICSTCHTKLHSFCTFKKQCLENYCRFTQKLRESGNAKEQSFSEFEIEIMNIKEENQVDVDFTNEASEQLNSPIHFITKEDTIKAIKDETISPGLNKYINLVSDKTDHIKGFEYEQQHDQTNNFIEDNIYIKKNIIKFKDSENPNLYQELLSDNKKEIDSEHDINEMESADLNINNTERTVEKDFQCSVCKKKFTQRYNLNAHIKIHSGVKDFQCTICDKKFRRNRDLKLHMKTHTGVKNFQCLICNKKFIQKSNLNYHMKVHAGVKDFQCSLCEKKFTLPCSLNKHMKIHTGVKDFHCSICERKFNQKSNLMCHIKVHTGVKDFQCSLCEKKFIQRSHLIVHMKKHTDSHKWNPIVYLVHLPGNLLV